MRKTKPDFVREWRDKKTGRIYIRFRKRGMKEVPLPGPIGSTAFWEAYRHAIDTKVEIGESRSLAGSVSAAIAAYYLSNDWTDEKNGFSVGTKGNRRPILERFREKYGHHPLNRLTQSFVVTYLDTLKPHAAKNHLKALRGLLQHAKHDVTVGMKRKAKSKRHASWPAEWVALFEARHPVGTKARLAYALARYTGAGRSEVARMGPGHVHNGEIVIARQKTGIEATIIIHPELQRALDATAVTGLSTFLVTKQGKRYQPSDLSEQFRAWCDDAGLPSAAVMHGLRHTMGDALADTGSTPSEAASVLGHASPRSAMHYMQGADRKRMGRKGMKRLIAETPIEPEVSKHEPDLTLGNVKPLKNNLKG